MRRLVLVGMALVAMTACGDDGPSLEDWAAQADDICSRVNDDVDQLELDTVQDVLDNGDEALEITQDGLDDLEALELPSGDDGETAEALVDALGDLVDSQEDLLGTVQDEPDDELAAYRVILSSSEAVDAGAEAADAAGATDCEDEFQDRQDDLETLGPLLDQLGPLADVSVGDCLTGIDDTDTVAPADCDGEDAEGQITSIHADRGQACGGEGSQALAIAELQFCISPFADPADEDGLLQIGSCLLLQGEQGADSVTVTEFPCDDLAVTHRISAQVRPDQPCASGDRRFAKSRAERQDSGPGDWCATPLD